MKIYLAARYARRKELKEYAKQLMALGHGIISSWLDERKATNVDYTTITPRFWREHANRDIEDLTQADAIVSFTEPKGSYQRGGGRHVEFGYGLAAGKALYLIGPREVIFHHLSGIMQFDTFEEFLTEINDGRD